MFSHFKPVEVCEMKDNKLNILSSRTQKRDEEYLKMSWFDFYLYERCSVYIYLNVGFSSTELNQSESGWRCDSPAFYSEEVKV